MLPNVQRPRRQGSLLPILAAACVIFVPPAGAAPPQISYVTNSAPNYSPIQVFGEGLTEGQVEFFGMTPPQEHSPSAMIEGIASAELDPPLTPPEQMRPMRVLSIQPQVATVVLYGGGHSGGVKAPYFIWAKNKDGFSEPYVINRPQLFFLERDRVAPGQQLRVFGRDLVSHSHRHWGGVFLRQPKSGKTYEAKWGKYFDRQNHFNYQLNFEIAFEVPGDIPEGEYDVWVHSGTGGWFGWCLKPLRIAVRKQTPVKPRVFDVRAHGAVGDGVADDVRAIQGAMDAAKKAGGGQVLVPAGVFAISTPLFLHSGVHLRGLRWEMSSLRIVDHLPFRGEYLDQEWQGYARDFLPHVRRMKLFPMMYVSSKSSVSDIEMIGGGGTAYNLYSFAGSGEFHDFQVTRCHLVSPGSPLFTTKRGFQPGRGCFGGGNPWRRVRITHNLMSAMHGCGTYSESHECTISHNRFEPQGGSFGTTGFATLSGWHNIIEGNVIRNANRGFTCGPWSQKNQGENFIARNQVIEGGLNKGAAESFLVEYGAGGHDGWLGRVSQAGPDWFEGSYGSAGRGLRNPPLPPGAFEEPTGETPKATFKPDYHQGLFAIVFKGRGFGQYRRVKRNTKERMYLEEAWRVVPDQSSWIVVRRMYYNSVFLNNVGRDTLGGLELWGGALENVIRRHTAVRTAPLHAMTHSEPTVMYNRFESCQLSESSLGLWNVHKYDYSVKAPTLVGNVFTGNQLEGGSILLVRRAYGKRGYVPLDDPEVVADGPSIAYNVFAANAVFPQSQRYAIHLADPSCFANVFWRNTYPSDRVLDKGKATVWEDNVDGLRFHFKDAYEYDVRAYERGDTK